MAPAALPAARTIRRPDFDFGGAGRRARRQVFGCAAATAVMNNSRRKERTSAIAASPEDFQPEQFIAQKGCPSRRLVVIILPNDDPSEETTTSGGSFIIDPTGHASAPQSGKRSVQAPWARLHHQTSS